MKWLSPLKKYWANSPKNLKIKLIAMLFVISILLLMFPASSKKTSNPQPKNMINQQSLPIDELEALLTDITGKKVEVMVAYADSGDVEVISEETVTKETKSVTGDVQQKRDEKPVLDANKNVQIKNRHPPKIKGVCIFYFGPYEKETEALLYKAAHGSLGADLHTVEVIFQSQQINEKTS